jgi:hypothetical protein
MSGMMQQQDITVLPAMVTMPVARWNQILEVLGKQPWSEVNPLIVDMHRQIQDAMQARQTRSMELRPPVQANQAVDQPDQPAMDGEG